MTTLTVIGMTMLGVVIGFALGARLTARRYQHTLARHREVRDITNWPQTASRKP